nr:Peptidase M12A domain containing protein [Haemonchus contortus]
MAKAHASTLFLLFISTLGLLETAYCLSGEGKELLAKSLPGGDLEKRRERLKHLGELFSKRYNLTATGQQVGKNESTDDGILDGQEAIVVANESTGLSVEEINQREGVAEYLFDGDINLTETSPCYEMTLRNNNNDFHDSQLPGYEGNFAKVSADRTNNYNPFDYGSVMHYAANLFTTQGYSLKPRIGKYLMTPGTRVVSFYDIKMLNDHYGCHAQCGAATCANGGEPRPKNCDVCNCPEGYGGAKCAARPGGCGETLAATAVWKTKTFTFGNAVIKTERDTYMRYQFTVPNSTYFKAPAGKKVQVRVTAVKNVQCRVGCRQNSIEIKYRPDKGLTNPR